MQFKLNNNREQSIKISTKLVSYGKVFLIIINLYFFLIPSLFASFPCEFLERKASYRGLLRYGKLFQKSEFILAGSFYGIKELNEIFGDSGVGAEHLVSVLHYLIQKNFYESVPLNQKNQFKILETSSPYLKFFTVKFDAKTLDTQALESLLLGAQEKAVAQLVEYVFLENQNISQLVAKSPAESRNGFQLVVPGMEKKLPTISLEKLKEIQAVLVEKFGKRSRIQEFFSKKLGVGVAHSEIDALLMSRLKTNYAEMFKGYIEFNLSYFLFAIHRIDAIQRNLGWFFDGANSLNLRDVVLVRKHYFKSIHEGFSKEYLDVLDRNGVSQNENSLTFQRILRHQQLKDFFDVLSLIDYLPTAKLTLDQTARQRFDSLKDPTIIGFMDIKGLGAKNYVQVYNNIPTIKKQMADVLNTIRALKEMEKDSSKNKALIEDETLKQKYEELSFKIKDLVSTREKILDESDQFVQQIRGELKRAIEGFGVKPEDYVIWASGDDVIFSLRTTRGSSMQILNTILANRILLDSTRAAAFDVKQGSISLSQSRALLGPVGVVSKHLEELGFEEFFIHSDGSNPSNLKIKFMQEDGRYKSANEAMLDGLNQNIFDNERTDFRFVR